MRIFDVKGILLQFIKNVIDGIQDNILSYFVQEIICFMWVYRLILFPGEPINDKQ